MDIPLVQEERRTVLTELEDIGVSRVLDHIYGFRFDEKTALKHVLNGPPSKS